MQTAENEAITFNGSQVSSPKQIANRFNEQFTTSKLGRHNSSRETRLVSREVRRNPKETTVTFTTDLVTRAIRSCSNTKAFGPDKLSIFHLKHLGPRATAYLTALFNDSVNSSRIPSIWKSSIVIPIPKPGKDTSQGTSYRPISLICPAAKVLEALVLPTVNAHLLPADDQHGFRPGHSTTSALLQLTTDIATGFNQKKPPHRTVCVAVDLTAAFDTVSHNVLISKISRSTLPEVTCRWLSCYLRGRQAVTTCRGVKSSTRIVHTGVPQGSKLSPSLFSFYLADMPRPTHPVKRICYADDISVWASGAKIPELEVKINDYLKEMSNLQYLYWNAQQIYNPIVEIISEVPTFKMIKKMLPNSTQEDIDNTLDTKIINRIENKLAEFSFKLIHNSLICGQILSKWTNISPNCVSCQKTHDIPHMIYHCTVCKRVWDKLSAILTIQITLKHILLMYDHPNYETKIFINYCITAVAYNMYKYWMEYRDENKLPNEISLINKIKADLHLRYLIIKYTGKYVKLSENLLKIATQLSMNNVN